MKTTMAVSTRSWGWGTTLCVCLLLAGFFWRGPGPPDATMLFGRSPAPAVHGEAFALQFSNDRYTTFSPAPASPDCSRPALTVGTAIYLDSMALGVYSRVSFK